MKKHTDKITIIKRCTLGVLLLVLILSLVPLLYLAKFDHPYRDDYTFSLLTHKTWVETGSVIKVIGASFKQIQHHYNSWTGTFSSTFFMSLVPSLWSEQGYILTPYIMIFLFVFSTLFFSYKLLVTLLKTDKTTYLIVTILIIMLSIQFIPSPVEGFYWYNGATHYLMFYCFALILFGLIIDYVSKNYTKSLKYYITCLPLAFITGGGNFVTALNIVILLSILMLYLLITKNKKWRLIVFVLSVSIIAMIISIKAPGNAIRQSFFVKQRYSPINSIIKSFENGYFQSFTLFNAPRGTTTIIFMVILAITALLPGIIKNPKIKFKYPLLFVFIIFCIYSSLFTPSLYAMGVIGSERLLNIIFLSYIWYLLFAVVYIVGWCYKKVLDINKENAQTTMGLEQSMALIYNKLLIPFILGITLICIAQSYILVDKNPNNLPTSLSAFKTIASGEAYKYDLERDERLEILKSDEKNIVFKPLKYKPKIIFKKDYIDESFVKYYNKESVKIE